ncbi:MAG: DNA topoisomerase I [archaeon]
MVQLIICEKPSAALKVAEALADGEIDKKKYNKKILYFEFKRGKKKIIVVCAVGHLFTVAEKEKKGWTYPVFDVDWKPTFEVSKDSDYTKPYYDLITKMCKGIDEIIVATDYDIEGEVIGFNIVKYICGKNNAMRMKFSTTTKEDLCEAYEHVYKSMDKKLTEAGLTRHVLDFYYGINLSRALSLAIRNATKMFKVLSSGRVQGPALKILVDKQREIDKFKSEPFWELELITKELNAFHKEGKFWDKKKVQAVKKNAKGKVTKVKKITAKQTKHAAPHPFDLTALQIEAFRQLHLTPKQTLASAQELYTHSYISYPRTSSNQLPLSIGYQKILKKLSQQIKYEKDCEDLLKNKVLKPNNGIKTDAAHPAIFPTGEVPKKLKAHEIKLYDLIVRRTLATFGEPATRETVTAEIEAGKELFHASGTRTIEKGWHTLYGSYAKFEEQTLPKLEVGQELKQKDVKLHEKETQPPQRYTQASIIKELEKRNLGTKATRAHIIDNLYTRNYVHEKSLIVTDLGMRTVQTLEKYCPDILSEELTNEIEKQMEEIREKNTSGKKVLAHAEKVLGKALETFKKNEMEIGKALGVATKETMEQESTVGPCNKCKEGHLRIMYSRKFKSYFIACSAYPDCKNTFSLTWGKPKSANKKCPHCEFPLVFIFRTGKRPFNYCFNKECPKRIEWIKEQETLRQEEAKKNEQEMLSKEEVKKKKK